MRNPYCRSIRYSSTLAILALSLLSLALTGCGLGSPAAPGSGLTEPAHLGVISGLVKGGEVPIKNGTVTLYATAANATGNANGIYTGGQATILGQSTTNSDGSFNITGATACAAPDQMYIVVSGGSPDQGVHTNSNILLMALAGSCPTANSNTAISEITTVATAYALASFTNITASCTSNGYTATPCVNITSSATNYDGFYDGSAYAGTGSTSAGMGLMHAIANANNLANMQTGYPNTTTTSGTGTVPVTEINTIADLLQDCVNSNGGASVANSTTTAITPVTMTAPATSTSGEGVYTISALTNNAATLSGSISFKLQSTGTIYSSGTLTNATLAAAAAAMNTAINPAPAKITFGTPVNGTATSGGTVIMYGLSPTGGASGAMSLVVGGTTYSGTISGSTPAALVTSIASVFGSSNGNFTVATTGSGAVKITGPVTGSVYTFTATNTSLVGTAGGTTVTPYGGTSLIFTTPTGSSNTITFSSNTLTGTYPRVSDGSNCGTLFAATPTVGSSYATNTLQAALNLVKNPYSSAANMSTLYGMITGIGNAFTPTLTSAPPDWTMAITYNSANTGLLYPYWLALDANDNMYIENTSASTSTFTKIVSLTSSGTLNTPVGGWVPSNSTTSTTPRGIAADSLGNLWIADNGTTTLNEYSTVNGTLTASYTKTSSPASMWGVAVDKLNNVWISYVQGSNGNVDEVTYSAGTSTGGTYAFNAADSSSTSADKTLERGTNAPYIMAFDQNQNLWTAGYYSNGYTVGTVVNTNAGTANPAAYTVSSMLNTTVGASASEPYGILVDASGNVWTDLYGIPGIVEITPTLTSGVVTGAAAGTAITTPAFNDPEGMAIDGNGVLWMADNGASTQGLLVYSTTGGLELSEPAGFKSCFVISNACGTSGSAAIYNARYPVIDSAGDVWTGVSAGGLGQTSTLGGTTELIGTAAPAWPLLATGKPGVMP